MITKQKFEKALDDAFGARMALAFDVLVQAIAASGPSSKPAPVEVAIAAFGATVRACLQAHAAGMGFAPATKAAPE